MSINDDYRKLKELEQHRKMNEKKQPVKLKKNLKEATGVSKQVFNSVTAFREIDLGKDIFYFLVIFFSSLADLLTLIPIAGNIFAIMFSVIIWVFYLFSGNLGRRKIAVVVVSQLIEILLPGLNFLPFFTISALVVYWLVLVDRKNKKK